MAVELFVLGCTGVVVFFHGASFLFHLLTQHLAVRSLREIHAHMIRFGCSEDPNLRNHLINLYAKCRFFRHARKLVDESPEPDLVSWSALISGYAQNGLGKEALSAFREMHSLGVKCNEFTFPSVLKACSITKDLGLGTQVHGVALLTGFESDEFVGNTLVVMYAKCGEFGDSRRLFDAIPERNVVSWNALFSCYVQSDFHGEAMDLFQEMVLSGVRPNEYSLSSIINACTGFGDGSRGRKIHGYMIKLGYESDSFSANALVDMYAKVKSLEDAVTVFEKIEQPDIVSWNAVIAGCVLHEYHGRALKFFRQMKGSGIRPNMFTLSSALKACAGLGFKKLGGQLHSFLIKMDTESDSFVNVGLIDMYCKCEMMSNARVLFEMMPKKDMIAWNAVISGHSQNGEDIEAVSLFSEMYKEGVEFNQTTLSTVLKATASLQAIDVCEQVHALSVKTGFESDMYVINSLLDTYGKCGKVEDAARIFKECPIEDVVAFTSMITAYSQYEQGEEALKLYLQMLDRENKPDSFVCSSLLNACANLSAYEQGKQIHVHILKFGFMSDAFAGNSLVNMYAKCGSIEDADRAFAEVPERGIVSWSAMIGGLAQHGHGREALNFFAQMLKDGVPPNHITLVKSSDIIVNNEYFTFTEIRPPSTQSLAPVTTQYPGVSSGPLNVSLVSTNVAIFGALLGGFNAVLNLVLIKVEMNPDFREVVEGPSHSDLRIFADATVENPSLKNKTFLIPMALASNQAFVTIDAESSMQAPLYSTGAVHTCENMLHLTGSK
ncbi:hypothetical protein C1H46_026230 [Malus baccata]|uniref:Pentatricopeptide repeat-containing protein n=1 Tax=Malus baccata TaxID=106549 RepID=A0A540LPB7_MALBA|nr:hypothetical protein C1H46_026230 [Malus baccata]